MEKSPTSIRISEDTKAQLYELGIQTGRSVSDLINLAIGSLYHTPTSEWPIKNTNLIEELSREMKLEMSSMSAWCRQHNFSLSLLYQVTRRYESGYPNPAKGTHSYRLLEILGETLHRTFL